jgi:hypothetical protein
MSFCICIFSYILTTPWSQANFQYFQYQFVSHFFSINLNSIELNLNPIDLS